MQIDGKTQLVGLIGWPVAHSFSPAMHNAAARALGLNWAYVPLPTPPELVETAVRALPALGFRGVNVTVPHKQAVMPFLHEIEAGARAIGAVNTIVVNQGSGIGDRGSGVRLVGVNTDGAGFMADLADLGVEVTGRACLILGAGGSARAVAYGLARAGAAVQVLARRPQQAVALAADLASHVPAGTVQALPLAELPQAVAAAGAPLIVNATPLGMSPRVDASPWPRDLPFPAGAFVYDLVYNPPQTQLMQQAQAAGCRAANGLGMLVQQGALAFARWTGRRPDTAVMRAELGNWVTG